MRRSIVLDPLESQLSRLVYMRAMMGLGLNFSNDAKAAELAGDYCSSDPDQLWSLNWETVTIYMPPYVGDPKPSGLIIAVEGYTLRRLLNDGVVPDIVVTDFDYEPDNLIGFKGIVIGHAHGDNTHTYIKYAKRISRLIPSVQVWPISCSILIPGFTDGDRAVYLAAYMGSRQITVRGFNPNAPIKRNDYVKRIKLKLAEYFINRASKLTNISVSKY
ncbi:6-hydroxymethylpterin diphosphokinase MptE-like protein [Caldivirga sp. UBA161]|uniref:6-hydroxymethylpterin diphosphokinase MptE-like protein n=1 Tax=Caldivirga sp. UBA161 TaxID=1915569 RepID=UPI0025BAF2C9|nr:6-hydroxymethylpterin diphosphokinase MptE-like protein [Caldivirga sp. UBA161]